MNKGTGTPSGTCTEACTVDTAVHIDISFATGLRLTSYHQYTHIHLHLP